MPTRDELYDALQADLDSLSAPLFGFAEQQVRERGAFYPVGAALDTDGGVRLLTAVSERESATSVDILELVLEGLQHAATDDSIVAVATTEWIRISGAGQSEQPAVKVHVHHRRGLGVTFYVPASKDLFGGWRFGDMIARAGPGIIGAWPTTA
jgi:hypothetical protein